MFFGRGVSPERQTSTSGSESADLELPNRQCSEFTERDCVEFLVQDYTPAANANHEFRRTSKDPPLREIGKDKSSIFYCRQIAQVDNLIKETASESVIHSAVRKAVAGLDFCVTIADPSTEDNRLIAVSEGFERMTGYSSEEIIGRNCRFLNDGCELEPWQRMGLRVASRTGALFSAVVINRKKSGELFKNLLNVRGLVIAENPLTGEDKWLLVGIQADVSELEDVPEDHLAKVAKRIRRKLVKQFAVLGMSAVLRSGDPSALWCNQEGISDSTSEWRMMTHAVWKEGTVSDGAPMNAGTWEVFPDSDASPGAATPPNATNQAPFIEVAYTQTELFAFMHLATWAVTAGVIAMLIQIIRGMRG